ncbi:hypothetical protein K504DRAFT_478135 [Pleomassaria siparia CBS 279.74]|uniref:RING-type domain-containing protein n=1 Tax=Pleomassaria siparia CBS 279.74 TaxID=1314801 RepID=A0A6G1KPL5_9PLEO|nr:hypothetical protein K504DRAFT_478135 [Pleomassaria siparia CBS 279.74]
MGTLTADCPQLESHCPHKLATSCRLTSTPNCCACADNRSHSRTYAVYVDGVGFVQRGTRWQSYCWFCKEFWNNRLSCCDPPLQATDTQIPNDPDQAAFLRRWFEFHQGFRLVVRPDGTEERIAVLGEPLREVSPGYLPRTLDQLRRGISNNASRPENRLRRDVATAEEVVEGTPHQSLEDALDSLLAEASDGETEAPASQETAVEEVETAAMPRISNRTEAHLQSARDRLVRVFGTREDVQRDDYESPLSSMYNRAWDRYRQAEQRRDSNTTSIPVVEGITPNEQHEIEQQLLWSVLQDSRRDNFAENQVGNVQSYTPSLLPVHDSSAMTHDVLSNATNAHNAPPSTSAPPSASMTTTSIMEYAAGTSDLRTSLEQISNEIARLRLASEAVASARNALHTRRTPEVLQVPTPSLDDQPNRPPPLTDEERLASEAVASAQNARHTRRTPEVPTPSLDDQPDRPPPLTDDEMTKKVTCKICYEQIADIAVLPCGHMVMCQWCADVVCPVRHRTFPVRPTRCPMCRRRLLQRVKIHMG